MGLSPEGALASLPLASDLGRPPLSPLAAFASLPPLGLPAWALRSSSAAGAALPELATVVLALPPTADDSLESISAEMCLLLMRNEPRTVAVECLGSSRPAWPVETRVA